MASTQDADTEPWFLKYTVPVDFPSHHALTLPRADFDKFVAEEISHRRDLDATNVKGSQSTKAGTDGVRGGISGMEIDAAVTSVDGGDVAKTEPEPSEEHPFVQGLKEFGKKPAGLVHYMRFEGENKMWTENHDGAYVSTTDVLVDLFAELEESLSRPRMVELLDESWAVDPLMTLKIIFNARSIHLGKSSRLAFYQAAGWLGQKHPLTLVANLRWLSRPVIEKKAEKGGEKGDDDMVIVEQDPQAEVDDVAKFDVKYGVSHGYWKDLLTILVLAVNDKLVAFSNPKKFLEKRMSRGKKAKNGPSKLPKEEAQKAREAMKAAARVTRRQLRDHRHERAVAAFNNVTVYRALHLTVARLFAEQLQKDLAALRSDSAKVRNSVTLCGKWAPTHDHFHDRHTFIVSSIAEIMYPRDSLASLPKQSVDRQTYLRYAREAYRKDVAALRKHLDIVERELTAKTYGSIQYEKIPSFAMKKYTKLFAAKDPKGFQDYLLKVAEGKANISGATLLPSTLVSTVRTRNFGLRGVAQAELQVADLQWKTLVQRIKDSGKLSSSIAVCDVSGSMKSPTAADDTTPMDSAIGLSLLLAEVTEPPFGGVFITFSKFPETQFIRLEQDLSAKVNTMAKADWGMNTDFVAVFRRLILPMAVKKKLTKDQMVKRVFVFSDMHFDSAQQGNDKWETSYDVIKQEFADKGYDMPELIFWNLASHNTSNRGIMPKPVTAHCEGTSLVSGYSQGMLKVFLDGGGFADGDDEDEVDDDGDLVLLGADGEAVDVPAGTRKAMTPLGTLKRAVGHKAYGMLEVLD